MDGLDSLVGGFRRHADEELDLIRSMTGFGDASAQIDGVHYFIEVRSLNSKYLKAVIRLPEEFQGLEAELDSLVRRRLTRGTVTVTGSCTDTSENAAFGLNIKALESYIEQIRKTPLIARGAGSIYVVALLSLPRVLHPPRARGPRPPVRCLRGEQARR